VKVSVRCFRAIKKTHGFKVVFDTSRTAHGTLFAVANDEMEAMQGRPFGNGARGSHLDPAADGIAEVQAPRTLWAQGNSVYELA
jgi:hypothetical protein